ncbi:MAG: type II toxin-antitoxin system RelE/ParE family toxin [Candidatus Omnitrophota bacterium]|jgi:plasmid stabilization system protein ParE|nr:MAG: type II toxin-antitoxin system RelE/ParE family toxin [Candidatus Omnitrophota bacterium]
MPHYRLTRAAEADLDDIWKYTYNTWGLRQAGKYLCRLKKRMELPFCFYNQG